MSLALRNLFWRLGTKKRPLDIQCGRQINWSSGFLSKIFDMSNIVRQPTTGLVGQPHKLLWPTNELYGIMSAVNTSLTTVQWKDELCKSAHKIIC